MRRSTSAKNYLSLLLKIYITERQFLKLLLPIPYIASVSCVCLRGGSYLKLELKKPSQYAVSSKVHRTSQKMDFVNSLSVLGNSIPLLLSLWAFFSLTVLVQVTEAAQPGLGHRKS